MSSPEQTNDAKLVNPPTKQTRMVKIRAKAPIRTVNDKGHETIHQTGAVVEVTEEEAAEFCDKKIALGYKDTFGQYEGDALKQQSVTRAERISK